ncbi:hypothetical protein LXL04_009313 [Taraxacum kok-saghyz]
MKADSKIGTTLYLMLDPVKSEHMKADSKIGTTLYLMLDPVKSEHMKADSKIGTTSPPAATGFPQILQTSSSQHFPLISLKEIRIHPPASSLLADVSFYSRRSRRNSPRRRRRYHRIAFER